MWPFETEAGPPRGRWWARTAVILLGVLGLRYLEWRRSPDVTARRLCAARYHTARTATDTAALDPVRTLARDGVAPHTCGELRLAGRLR